MKKTWVLISLVLSVFTISIFTSSAQVAINQDGTNADASAILDINSSDKGMLIPRLTSVEISSITSPANGLTVFCTTDNKFFTYILADNEWKEIAFGSGSIPGPFISCGDYLTDSRDGQFYATTQIGTQCWMAENLNIGNMISGTVNQSDNGTIEKYCYNDITSNCDTYGGLYLWHEAMQYVTSAGTQGICPAGWHIPTDAEWMAMEETLGMCSGSGTGCSGFEGFRGTNEASKLAGNESLWTNGVLDQNAEFGISGFNILPAGYRFSTGSFALLSDEARIWTSSEYSIYGWSRWLLYSITMVKRTYSSTDYGFSVRCIKD